MGRNPIWIERAWRPVASVASARPLGSPHLHVGRRTTPCNTSAASAAAAWQTARLLILGDVEPSRDTCLDAGCARPRLPIRRVRAPMPVQTILTCTTSLDKKTLSVYSRRLVALARNGAF